MCLAYNGVEKFYGAVEWLRYLISHLPKPDAEASRAGGPQFDGFTFDHVLEGMVVGCRRDNKELFAITVANNHAMPTAPAARSGNVLPFPQSGG